MYSNKGTAGPRLQIRSRMNPDWIPLESTQYPHGGPHQPVRQFPDDDSAAKMMQTLMDEARGTYIVRTSSSTVYLVNLDLAVLRRIPGDAPTTVVAALRRDYDQIDLLAVYECTVGKSMELIVDFHLPFVPFTIRRSMPVVSIERLSDEEEAVLL